MLSARPPNVLQERTDFNLRAFASKTPGRPGTQNIGGLKSAIRKENALRAPMTTLARSKATINLLDESIEPKRLFKDFPGKLPAGNGLSDVTNKTPALNRRQPLGFKTPLPGTSKLLKLAPLLSTSIESAPAAEAAPTPLREPPPSALRPSSSRRTSRIIRSASKSFETPAPSTRKPHWDVNEDEISVGSLEDVEIKEDVNEDDESEIEYMPPTAWIEPYEAPLPLPDYKALCPKLWEIARMPGFGDPNEDVFDDSFLETWVPAECPPEDLQIPLRPLQEEEFFGPPLQAPKAVFARNTAVSRIAKSPATRDMSRNTTRPSVPRSQATSTLSRPLPRPVPVKPASRPQSLALNPSTRTGIAQRPSILAKPAAVKGLTTSKPLRATETPKAPKPTDTLEVFMAPPDFTALDDGFRFDV
ncbi:hypothetical protein DACRYDRAFT_114637 [Dacryopinax primogenitus]|uniref:Uncharacterized protein n=1 Tax=Dacryopinax primogenitus (strain DJM 731) TaxID=1858805 RepID=M5G6G4_DACPD|nr:uncharacterized protein DACRYDRAFT_114637 [Dacryopinax primogenitus]EJU04284.1 hypothetical protein DACRYDRAFT_114637 [Dacryopinax primogenitus]